jgi:endoglucanase
VSRTGSLLATSPTFAIQSSSPYLTLVSNSIFFFRAQRDGPDVSKLNFIDMFDILVPTVMNRKPSHLTDQSATIYQTPTFNNNDEVIGNRLTAIGGPVDVSGKILR